jgi:hypothetical protein
LFVRQGTEAVAEAVVAEAAVAAEAEAVVAI